AKALAQASSTEDGAGLKASSRVAESPPVATRAPAPASRPVGALLLLAGLAILSLGAVGGWVARGQLEKPRDRVFDDWASQPSAGGPKVEIHTTPPAPATTVEARALEPSKASRPAEPSLANAPAPAPIPAMTAPGIVGPTAGNGSAEDAAPVVVEAKALGDVLPTLDVYSVPDVDVLLGTRSLGHTPFKVPVVVPSGKQTITLVNTSLGIRATREVEIQPHGVTHLDLRVGVGSVGFHAPNGAKILLDRKLVGIAPVERRLQLYEGTHHVAAVMGEQRWEETFKVEDGDWLSFTARLEMRPRGDATPTLRFVKEVSAETKPEVP
ncbi:MAG: hypothetical protein HY901_33940, partial [Deltaproteobacteria bacterium]|nr:hypothetical protein [Deltaproteobacteria bacterium]